MRADLPPAVAQAIERSERPSLVFDHERITANLRAIAVAAQASGVTTLFAAKSFPAAAVRELAATALDGFDAASAQEVRELPAARVLSIVDPSGRAVEAAAHHRGRLIVGCETIDQVTAAPAHAEIAIRISASITGRDPAIGAVLDGSGHRRSRFGLDAGEATLGTFVRAAAGRPVGLHVHHGPVTATTSERFLATARAVLALAAEAELVPSFLDLGGAWHGIADLAGALRDLRAAVPREIELIIEPGRRVTEEAGFACGRVVVARELADRPLRVIDLSRICHLRWSQIELVGPAPHAGEGRSVLVVGPTCYEEDVIGEWTLAPDRLAAGDRVVLRHVSGYAVAWNTSFGGVPAADVVIA
ncbi:MAG: lysA1 [Myxococcales bacterium]|nr:lysA1 [Myxococcales bacterium]